jgi:thioredoxin 1
MSNPQKQVITVFHSKQEFLNLLQVNPGLIIIKFGASWCGPCKRIARVVEAFFATSPPNVVCCEIDIDESFELYSFLKNKNMINGVPTMFCYFKGNTMYSPDDSVVGSDPKQLSMFFERCAKYSLKY